MRSALAVLAAPALFALAPRAAVAAKDVTPVLQWVRPEGEAGIREAFRPAVAVRGLGKEVEPCPRPPALPSWPRHLRRDVRCV